jgi:hypothetical protein
MNHGAWLYGLLDFKCLDQMQAESIQMIDSVCAVCVRFVPTISFSEQYTRYTASPVVCDRVAREITYSMT